MDAYVHLVESPTTAQLFHASAPGQRLNEVLGLAGIKTWYRAASDLASFDLGLRKDVTRAIRHHDALPLFHLGLQVDRNGAELTDGTFLTLEELSQRITLLNQALEGRLIVCIPGCSGTAAARMATADEQHPPYYAIVGSHDHVAPGKAVLGYAAFYNRLLNGASLDTAMDALSAASGTMSFYVQYSGEVRTVFSPVPPKNPAPGHHRPPPTPPPGTTA